MPDDTAAAGAGAPPRPDEERAIRQRVRELTSQVLQQGRVDPAAVTDVVRAVTGQGSPGGAGAGGAAAPEGREGFAAAVQALDAALLVSASGAHAALTRLAARGIDFTENDLKDTLAALRALETDYAAAAGRVAAQMSGDLRREMGELAAQAQHVGTEASARVAALMGEFASRMGEGAGAGLETVRGASMRMALLASGVLAGIADALSERSAPAKDK